MSHSRLSKSAFVLRDGIIQDFGSQRLGSKWNVDAVEHKTLEVISKGETNKTVNFFHDKTLRYLLNSIAI